MTPSLNYGFSLNGLKCSNASDLPALQRHRWYFVKEAFSPILVNRAIESAGCGEGDIVVDPFCGSGTSLLAAADKGASTIGCEVNPFLAFTTRTKLTNSRGYSLKKHVPGVQTAAQRGHKSPLEGISTFTKSKGLTKWLFNKDVIRSFEGGWCKTGEIPSSTRNLIRLALIGAAMDCCNATQDGKCLRYRKDWGERNYGKEEFLDRLDIRLKRVEEDLQSHRLTSTDNSVVQGDCRKQLRTRKFEKFKLCVTSPPYLNSFDYSDIYRPEMFLGKFVHDIRSL